MGEEPFPDSYQNLVLADFFIWQFQPELPIFPVLDIYCRSDFDCEILLIANCEFFHNSQSKESQVKEYAMNNITCDHAPSVQVRAQVRSRSRSYFPHVY